VRRKDDEFKKPVRDAVAKRVGFRCSNPACQKITSGPSTDLARAINIGVASHITAAAEGGPRFNASLSSAERSSVSNAIWLCQSCAALVDRDVGKFTEPLLREWKSRAERSASVGLASGSEFRPIAASEIRQELSLAELLAIKEMSQEFGCHVESRVAVPFKGGESWMNLHGAVVRGEDLVAIEIHESSGRGIRYFQLEYLVEMGEKLSFERFRRFVLYVVIVSSAPKENDAEVRARLDEIAARASFEMRICILRLNELKAKYGY